MKMKFLTGLICLVIFSLSAFAQSKEPTKIDEFGNNECEFYLATMDNAIVQASENPASKIYVLVYEGKIPKYKYKKGGGYEVESVFPQYGLANVKIRSMKKYLFLRKSSAQRFVFVKAGFREDFSVEIWLVPSGVMQPKPTPTLAKMKYRKGKPLGFCLGCCGE